MKSLLLTFKNIKKFITKRPVMFLFLFIIQIICSLAVFISTGMAYNINYVEKELDEQRVSFGFLPEEGDISEARGRFDDGDPGYKIIYRDKETNEHILTDKYTVKNCVPITKIKELLPTLVEELSDYSIKDVMLFCYPSRNIDISRDRGVHFYIYYPLPGVEYPKDSYIDSDEHIILSPNFDPETGKKYDDHYIRFKIGETYNYHGSEYKCIGNRGAVFFPYKTVPDDFLVFLVRVDFNNELYSEDIQKVLDIGNGIFGTDVTETFNSDPVEPFELQLSQMLYYISIAVMIIVILSIAKFYRFVLEERKNNLMVLRLCGCTRGRVHLIYMVEIFITMLISTLSGFLIFKYLLFDSIQRLYPSFGEFYQWYVYVAIIGAYILLSIIIMFFAIMPATRVSVAEMKRDK